MSTDTHDKDLTMEQLFAKALNIHPDQLVIGEISSHNGKELEILWRLLEG